MNDGLVEDYQIGIGLSDWHQIGPGLVDRQIGPLPMIAVELGDWRWIGTGFEMDSRPVGP